VGGECEARVRMTRGPGLATSFSYFGGGFFGWYRRRVLKSVAPKNVALKNPVEIFLGLVSKGRSNM
jgi:hypothetical protein